MYHFTGSPSFAIETEPRLLGFCLGLEIFQASRQPAFSAGCRIPVNRLRRRNLVQQASRLAKFIFSGGDVL